MIFNFFKRLKYKNIQRESFSAWEKAGSEKTFLFNYNLNEDSLVFDIGSFEGNYAEVLYDKYHCNIYAFEPVKEFADKLEIKFKNNDKIKVFPIGLSGTTAETYISHDGSASSIFGKNKSGEIINLKKVSEFIKENNIQYIDLMKINIEGAEYELLNDLLESSLINNVGNILVQFHTHVKNPEKAVKAMREKLSKTHHPTFQFDFIWENWEKTAK